MDDAQARVGAAQQDREPFGVGGVGFVDAVDDERAIGSSAVDVLVEEVDEPVGDPPGAGPGIEAGALLGRRRRRQRLAVARDDARRAPGRP